MSEPIERIICGDNLEVLKTIATESVDLCYIDPPFFSGRNYAVIWNDGAEIRQFEDRWVKMGKKGRMSKDINVYLDWMKPRLEEIYRVLKKIGSFYLHADYHADSYLRVMCDKIFGYNKLVSDIKWKRTLATKTSHGYGNNLDSILLYNKSNKSKFKIEYTPSSKELINRDYKMIEKETGKKFQSIAFILNGNEPKNLIFKNYPSNITDNQTRKCEMYFDENNYLYIKAPKGKRFVWNQETLDKRLKSNPNRIYWTKNGNPRIKKYAEDLKGTPLDNLWIDIKPLSSGTKERLGYPTQKPEALLERIIKASSNEGDLVLDAFCGCGTTLAVAKRLNRQFIGIDVSPTSCRLMAKRIQKSKREVEGLPLTKDEIKKLSGWEFQNWINREFGSINGKRGADGGIDGTFEKILIQVKKYKVGRPDLDSFSGVLVRKDKKEGIFIGLEFTSTFIKEVSRLKRENEIDIHYFTADDILEGKHKKFTYTIRMGKFLGRKK